MTHARSSLRLAALCLAALCLATAPVLAQDRTQGTRTTRTSETRTGVTPAEEAVVFHAMLALSPLEGQQVGPVVSGRMAVVRCDDCGDFPGDPLICTDLRQAAQDAATANLEAGKMVDLVQAGLNAYGKWTIAKLFGEMVIKMVGAATTILTAGAATGPVLAAAQVLVQMGEDAAIDAIMDAIAEALGIDISVEGGLEELSSRMEAARNETNDQYQDAMTAWRACLGRRSEMQAAVDAWNDCWATRQCWIEER